MSGYRIAAYGDADTERRYGESPKRAMLPSASTLLPRSTFARDRARVLHSGSFRRLAGKTQVVAPNEDEVPRTRLTHSLEVAQISREVGALLGCDPDLVDLAGLAHDIGHPPFGHNGEIALDQVADACGGFEANAQNLRLLTRLEAKVMSDDGSPYGLNLSRAALDSVIKYPFERPAGGGKFGVFAPEVAVFEWVRSAVPSTAGLRATCLEAQVMDWADDVAYSVHDVEDGIHAHRVNLAHLADEEEGFEVCVAAANAFSHESTADLQVVLRELLQMPVVRAAAEFNGTRAGESALLKMTSELTGRFATGAAAATRASSGREPLHRYDANLVIPRQLAAEVAVLKAIAQRYVMQDPVRHDIQNEQRRMLLELVGALLDCGAEQLDRVFAASYREADDDASRLRVVIDQVSLLTDEQALTRHRRLLRPR
ncbi:deoxyguanosinetriphosphate triphosphohydrolase [Nakamurella antarctica]|uniref:Deoxyguanosinetriphosphate triphosphohydrolase n=1 Tax=Nakamurella antarctica TaxID=1902245 RepID=A0A3G8ZLM7_9ACTN|nr:deoxyguanosinetriphosphate triphosphohydrolase [Nakamurella antarctica]AZI58242.1 deoxyguanosinetriphosphate triphosphohydrolase [Nakamurella antarctica]